MRSVRNLLLVLLALTTVSVATLAWRQHRALAALRGGGLDQKERADLQKRIWDLEKSNRQLLDQIAALRSDEGDVDAALVAGAGALAGAAFGEGRERPRGGRANVGALQGPLRDLLAKPETQAVLTMQRKLGVERQYAALFRNLNLTPEQAERLKSIIADRPITLQDARNIAREQGLDQRSDPDGFRLLMERTRNDIDNSIKAVIGEAGFTQLRTYEQTMPQRALANDLQQRLSYGSAPLTSDQTEQLVQILAANQPPQRSTGDGDRPPRPLAGGGRGAAIGDLVMGLGGRPELGAIAGAVLGAEDGPVITSAAITQAQTILSPPQVAALQQMQQQQQAQQQLEQAVRATLQDGRGGPGGGRRGGRGRG